MLSKQNIYSAGLIILPFESIVTADELYFQKYETDKLVATQARMKTKSLLSYLQPAFRCPKCKKPYKTIKEVL